MTDQDHKMELPQPSPEEEENFVSAARNNDTAVLTAYLDKYGAGFVNAKSTNGWTALMWSAAGGHEDTAKFLLERGADIEARNKTLGLTPLMWAALMGHDSTVLLLLEKGADITAVDSNGNTAQLWAEKVGLGNAAEVLKKWSEAQKQKELLRQEQQQQSQAAENNLQKLKQLRPAKPARPARPN